MKKGPTIFLQATIALIGVGALVFLLGEPHVEGRNAHASLFEIYFKDPFLAYAYLASTSFFTALYQAFKVLGNIGRAQAFTPANVKALRTIRFCAVALIGFVVLGVVFIVLGDSDDHAGGVVMGLVASFASAVIAAAALTGERVLQNGLDLKSGDASGR